ncbi:unnamed protein product [Heterobilharzia americana]|nr:unnamed protein product [Heterobilharzia americana]
MRVELWKSNWNGLQIRKILLMLSFWLTIEQIEQLLSCVIINVQFRIIREVHGELQKKIDAKREQISEITMELSKSKLITKRLASAKEALSKLQLQATDRDENKEIALSTSKLNYLDPRISVAWCKKYNVPIEKIFNRTQREKFQWAIDMATASYKFLDVDSDRSTNKLKAEDSNDEDMIDDED